jgi:hypothetical protein
MARRIRLDQIGDYAEDKLNQLMRVVVLETDAELKARSPVDTGRFRASWAIGENFIGNYDGGAKQPATGANRKKSDPPALLAWPASCLELHAGQRRDHKGLQHSQQLALCRAFG